MTGPGGRCRNGWNLPALIGRLRQLEDARRRLLHQRDELPAASQLVRIDWRLIERQAREKREKLGIVAGSRRCSIPCGIRTFTLY